MTLRTERTRLRRLPGRGFHDRETIHAVLDAALVSHLAFTDEAGQPFAVPTLHARRGEEVLIHGSSASRALRRLRAGVPVCLTATLIDGLVLARAAFHHSVNYRSVLLLGHARPVDDPAEKARALEAFAERLAPGRWPCVRPPTRQELKATSVLVLPIAEASAKVRTGPPSDDAEDMGLGVWAGVVPLRMTAGAPEPDPQLPSGTPVPEHVRRLAGAA